MNEYSLRIGIGRDLHRLVEERRFLIGGVHIPFNKGEAGHSDGDVLCHALIDAMLGASGLGDVGELFPPSSPQWKDANSLDLLAIANKKLKDAGWQIINIDSVIECEAPKILPYRNEIRASIAAALGIDLERVFIKGKTAEALGDIGSGNAVAANVVCLLTKN
ncbi:MAG: 2-C-methyl-D-erythritol 2,4-cyclodiphosphate synthase [Spirochaetaceae bacterium]|jgi:2-C-methyl-D-erythritol 2,4-cyclodiphosphate synthase|nr:2-C-methyl-D-erythritol 2,4-cyclodiphosphate synthase [Spirochaetaceae bacterium]GMO26701.1 MAG: 2-C-methyl-D-erythritol 2,4-cyclodiphosphate synthase [Termitinemataceae bacterium]